LDIFSKGLTRLASRRIWIKSSSATTKQAGAL